jgi:hypothetical protein
MNNGAEKYVVSFFDRVSGWLHSTFAVEVENAAEAVGAALENAKASGLDLSSHNASVANATTGEGVPSIVTSTSQTALEKQMAELQRQLADLKSASHTVAPAEISAAPETDTDTDADAGVPAMPARPSQQ